MKIISFTIGDIEEKDRNLSVLLAKIERKYTMELHEFNEKYFLETKSPAFARTLLDCKRVAASNANVLLIGESGTGKDIAAGRISPLSPSTATLIRNPCWSRSFSAWSQESFPTP